MSQKINTNKFLKNVRIGLWRIEVEEGKLPRFYADEVMDELLGITEEITPEERFAFHRRCVHPDDMEMFLEYSDKKHRPKSYIVTSIQYQGKCSCGVQASEIILLPVVSALLAHIRIFQRQYEWKKKRKQSAALQN